MDWKFAVTVSASTVLGACAVVLQLPAVAIVRRWIAYPWFAATQPIVALTCLSAMLGVSYLLNVWGRPPLVAFFVGLVFGTIYVRVAYRGKVSGGV